MRAALLFILVVLIAPTSAFAPASALPPVPNIQADGADRFVFGVTHTLHYAGNVEYSELNDGVQGWAGALEGVNGNFSMIEVRNKKYARIHVPGRAFKVESSSGGNGFDVTEINTTHEPPCGTGRHAHGSVISAPAVGDCSHVDADAGDPCYDAEQAMATDAAASKRACMSNPDPTAGGRVKIQTLVVYTPAVAAAHSYFEIWKEVVLSLIESNAAFSISKIDAELRLAKKRDSTPCLLRTPYAENANFYTDLGYLIHPNDGQLDDVATLRTQCEADVVVLLLNTTNAIPGMTCVMKSLGQRYAPYAQGVVYYPSLATSYIFTHEVGHMFGGGHDHTDNCSRGMCLYSAGWHFNYGGSTYRTMMAYDGDRSLHFSDPKIRQGGFFGSPTGASNANNARTLRISRKTVSQFVP